MRERPPMARMATTDLVATFQGNSGRKNADRKKKYHTTPTSVSPKTNEPSPASFVRGVRPTRGCGCDGLGWAILEVEPMKKLRAASKAPGEKGDRTNWRQRWRTSVQGAA